MGARLIAATFSPVVMHTWRKPIGSATNMNQDKRQMRHKEPQAMSDTIAKATEET
jgi:hypothetical protein